MVPVISYSDISTISTISALKKKSFSDKLQKVSKNYPLSPPRCLDRGPTLRVKRPAI